MSRRIASASADDDKSQQPRQKTTPSATTRRNIAKEDHLEERKALSDDVSREKRPSRGSDEENKT